MNEKNYPGISAFQLAAVIIICRVFTLMTHIPLINEGFTLPEQLAAIAASSLAGALLLIPSAVLYGKYGRAGTAEAVMQGCRPAGIISSAVCALYLLFSCILDLSAFSDFMNARFPAGVPVKITALVMTAACIYCAYCGIEGIARGSGTVIFLFVIMVIFMIGGSADKISFENIRQGFGIKNTAQAFFEDLSGGTELALLCLMGKYTAGNFRKGGYFALAGRLVCAAGITLSAVLILGDYAYMCSYPFLDMGSAAGINFLQRIDSVYMMIWVLTAVLTISLKIYIGAGFAAMLGGKINKSERLLPVVIFAAVIYLCAAFTPAEKLLTDVWGQIILCVMLGIITVVIPLAAMCSIRKKRKAAGNEKQS